MNFYLFRHGQTHYNIEKRLQGHLDIPLNDQGRKEAEKLRVLLRKLPIQAIVSSDLSRARETAKIALADFEHLVELRQELRETHMGDYQGKTLVQLLQDWGDDYWKRWTSSSGEDMDLSLPGGESKREQLTRVQALFEELKKRESLNHVAISTHGGVVGNFISFITGYPKGTFFIKNCQLFHLRWVGGKWEFLGELGAGG